MKYNLNTYMKRISSISNKLLLDEVGGGTLAYAEFKLLLD